MAGKPGRRSSAARPKAAAPAPATPAQPAWRRPPAKPRSRMRKRQALAALLNPATLAKRLVARPAVARPAVARRPAQWTWPRINWRWLALLPVAALLVYGVVQIFGGYEFYVYAADIQGNTRIASQAIYDASGVDKKSIFWVNSGQAAERVAALPGVATANVRVRLPNRVTINVQERTPLAVWQAGDAAVWIATDGAPMPALGAPPALTLIDTTSMAADNLSTTTSAAPSAARAVRAARSISETAESTLRLRPNVYKALVALHARRPDVTSVHYGLQEGLYFRAPEGWTVFLGDTGDIAGRLALLEASRPRIVARSVPPTVVDLRVDNNIYLR